MSEILIGYYYMGMLRLLLDLYIACKSSQKVGSLIILGRPITEVAQLSTMKNFIVLMAKPHYRYDYQFCGIVGFQAGLIHQWTCQNHFTGLATLFLGLFWITVEFTRERLLQGWSLGAEEKFIVRKFVDH
jgi:hypothetical protein